MIQQGVLNDRNNIFLPFSMCILNWENVRRPLEIDIEARGLELDILNWLKQANMLGLDLDIEYV